MRRTAPRHLRFAVAPLAAAALLATAPATGSAAPRAQSAVVNGVPITQSAYIAALLRSDTEVPLGTPDFNRQFCGGSLIDARTVLTAAHCLFGPGGAPMAAYQLDALIGRSNLAAVGGRKHAIAAIATHPSYNPQTGQYDIARLTLAEASNQLPVAVIAPGQEALWPANANGFIAGWGALAEGGPFPTQLQMGAVPIRDDRSCLGVPGQFFDPVTQVCAGFPGGGIDTCQGDSGGPLFVEAGTRQVLVGVTSQGRGCGRPQSLGIYARLGSPAIHTWATTGQLPAAAPPAATPPPAAASVRVILQSVRRRGGRKLLVRGRTVPVLARVRVNVQRRVRGRWISNGHVVTRANGTYRGTVVMRAGLQRVRVVIAAGTNRARAESRVMRVRVR